MHESHGPDLVVGSQVRLQPRLLVAGDLALLAGYLGTESDEMRIAVIEAVIFLPVGGGIGAAVGGKRELLLITSPVVGGVDQLMVADGHEKRCSGGQCHGGFKEAIELGDVSRQRVSRHAVDDVANIEKQVHILGRYLGNYRTPDRRLYDCIGVWPVVTGHGETKRVTRRLGAAETLLGQGGRVRRVGAVGDGHPVVNRRGRRQTVQRYLMPFEAAADYRGSVGAGSGPVINADVAGRIRLDDEYGRAAAHVADGDICDTDGHRRRGA